jgi:hypothetical protein
MKTYKIGTLMMGIAMACASQSCTNLDETVYDSIPSDQFGNTQKEINTIIAPIYSTLKNVWPGDFMSMIEESSDMAITPTRIGGDWWDGGYHMEMARRTWTYMNSLIKSSWNNCMNGISTCNQVYYMIENSDAMSDDLKKQTLAEIRGVRAYWYYMLVDNFGNAPLVTDFSNTDLPTMSDRKTLFNFVVDELNEIVGDLSEDVSSNTYGKFTKGAAYTLLAKMYLNSEEWIGQAQWQKAADACDKVMAMSYIIESSWKTNFAVQNEVSKEAILAVPFSKTLGGNILHNKTLHYKDPIALGFTRSTWNGISAQTNFVKQFDVEDERYEGTFLIGPMIDPSTGKVIVTDHGRDLIHTVEFNMENTAKYDGVWGEVQQEEGARCNKWVYESGMNNTAMENDYHIFRLADVYLMKAEALIRLGQTSGEAVNLINTIRERGYGNSDHNYDTVDLDKVYLERRLELAWELTSRQDMIRFGKFTDPTEMCPEGTSEYRKLFPIPYTAWQTNQNLVQNPGYPSFGN